MVGPNGEDIIFSTGFDQDYSDLDYGAIWKYTNRRDQRGWQNVDRGWEYRDRYYFTVSVPMYPGLGGDEFTYYPVGTLDPTSPNGFRLFFIGNPGGSVRIGAYLLNYPALICPCAPEGGGAVGNSFY